MLLNLRRIKAAYERFEKVYQPEALTADRETFLVVAPVVLGFEIFKDKEHFRLAGRLETTLELSCGRCLEPFRWPIESVFDLRYQPHATKTGDGEVEVEEDDLTTAFYENDEIDLGQLMREQFYLALPMKPLCRPDCTGLCPSCGANLNQGACGCRIEWEDPRLAVLKKLNVEH